MKKTTKLWNEHQNGKSHMLEQIHTALAVTERLNEKYTETQNKFKQNKAKQERKTKVQRKKERKRHRLKQKWATN